MKYLLSLFAASLLVYASCNNTKSQNTTVKENFEGNAVEYDSAAAHYQKFCSGCHGQDFEKFKKADWSTSHSLQDVAGIIKNGIENEGMPAYDTAFTDAEINSLAKYVIAGKKMADEKIEEAIANARPYQSTHYTILAEQVVTNLEVPWSMLMLPDGALMFTERKGTLNILRNGKELIQVGGVPQVRNQGQGGLLDVKLHPQFAQNKLLYLSYSKQKNNLGTTAVVRCKLEGNTLVNVQEIFEALPYESTSHHYAGRLLFDTKGYLFVSVGERGREQKYPQSVNNALGKVHRINDDGSIPTDNPFYNTAGAVKSIYTYGNRNPQGLALQPVTGIVWENEHGPQGGDEVNILQPGKNYGWPIATYGINYNGTEITSNKTLPGVTDPVEYWVPSFAPGNLCFVSGDKYPAWQGNILQASLKFDYLLRCEIVNNKVTRQEIMLKGIGRMRDVQQLSDGYIYISTENPGTIHRLRIKK